MSDLKIGTSSYTIDDLASKYRGFFAPAFEILINGTNIVKESVAVTTLTVTNTIADKASSFTFRVGNAFDLVKREFQWVDSYFVPGNFIEIKLGYVDKLQSVFYGVVTDVSYDFPESSTPSITVSGQDLSFLMMHALPTDATQNWKNKKHSDIVKEIGGKYGLSTGTVDATSVQQESVDRNKMEDYALVREFAKLNFYEFFVYGKNLYFRKPFSGMSASLTLTWSKSLRSFKPKINLGSQITEVVAKGRDKLKNTFIEATSQPITKIGSGSKTGPDIVKALGGGNRRKEVMTNFQTQEELQTAANALLNNESLKLISGTGTSIGLPELEAGRYIKLEGVGKTFSTLLYMRSVTHQIDASGGYLTTFEVGGNAI